SYTYCTLSLHDDLPIYFLELAFSTRSRIFDTVDSPNSFVVRTFRTPVMLMHPLIISFPSFASFGRLSPVSALVFTVEVPSTMIPDRKSTRLNSSHVSIS